MQDDGGGGGGVWGEGCRQQCQATTPGLLNGKPPPPQPYPLPHKAVATVRPHIRGGGSLLGGKGVGLGWGAAKPPKPLPPPVLFAVFSAHCLWWGPASSTGWGWGCYWGFLGLSSWVVGWAWVPCTCLPPPLSIQEGCAAPGACTAPEWRGGGGGGENQGIVGPPSIPPSLGAAPKKNRRQGKGGGGGGNHPQHQTCPSPYPPPSQARTKAQKVRGWDGSGKGVGRGGTSPHHNPTSASTRTGP